jgi:uncharacterized surface protein with fasciclin (FAS1) repeats
MNIRLPRFALCTLILPSAALAESPRSAVVASFADQDALQNWVSVNDSVMGGVSKGGFKLSDNATLIFSGKLSLENNGGFASIRMKPRELNLAGASDLKIRARGDGRTYWAELRTSGQMGASSYRADLPTTDGEWTEINIPLDSFKLQAFGQKLPGSPVNLAKVDSIGFTLADKKAGPFSLEVEYVKAEFGSRESSVDGSGGTLVDVATAAGSFKTLLAAAAAADLAGALSGDGPLTLFAPTDEAFAKLPAGTIDELLKPENRAKLADILKYHVIAGRVPLAKALEAGEAATLQGAAIKAGFTDGRVRVGPATLLKADIPASNGLIHVIDQVLLPPESTSKPLDAAGLIELAIQRGVPLFNDGHHGACVAVYEMACESLRMLPGISEVTHKELETTLSKMKAESSVRQKAWILRGGLDRVYLQVLEKPLTSRVSK